MAFTHALQRRIQFATAAYGVAVDAQHFGAGELVCQQLFDTFGALAHGRQFVAAGGAGEGQGGFQTAVVARQAGRP